MSCVTNALTKRVILNVYWCSGLASSFKILVNEHVRHRKTLGGHTVWRYANCTFRDVFFFFFFTLQSGEHKHTLRFNALPDSWLLYTETHTQTHAGSKLNVTKPVS